jgi:hypothetical protein
MTSRTLKLTLLGALAALSIPAAAFAQDWHRHPGYLRAMSDLRTAYWLVQHTDAADPAQHAEEKFAAEQIKIAYMDLKNAAIMDDRDINDLPPPGMAFYDHQGRLRRAGELILDAHSAIAGVEQNPESSEMRKQAFWHIDKAGQAVAAAQRSWGWDRR